MKDFFKFTFASCLGVFLAFIVCMIFFSMIAGVMVNSASSSGGGDANINSHSILSIDLNRTIPELTNNAANNEFSFENPEMPGLHDILHLIDEAKEDEDIEGIFINAEANTLGISNSTLVQEAIREFKESGKPVYAQGNYITQSPYLVASAADKIYLSPTGAMDFRGFGAILPFVKGTLDKLGVKTNVFYAGQFKSATEPFRRTDMSEQNRRQTREYVNAAWNEYLSTIAQNRDLSVAQLKQAANDLGTIQPKMSLKQGMIDHLGYRSDAFAALKEEIGLEQDDKMYFVDIDKYFKAKGRFKMGKGSDRIAVVYAEGTIGDGQPEPGSITGKQYVKTLSKIEKDDKIKAVVLRVNSGGGSIIASDNIWKKVEDVQAAGKPVVVSMGDYAASGGYYIACSTDKIFAQPNTLTGSIGVFNMMFNTRELMEDKLGMTFDTVSTGTYSTRLNGIYDFDKNESDFFQNMVDNYYNLFLERVAEGRNMTVDQVDAVAQGRVWTGNKAKELGLVDEIGELDDAIAAAAELAELETYKTVSYPKVKNQLEQLLEEFTGKNKSVSSHVEVELDHQLTKMIPNYALYKDLMENPGVQARVPFVMTY